MHEIQAMTIVDQLVAELALGRARSVAFVVPSDATQTAPLYDVAIATARRGWMIGLDDVRYWFVTPEPEPVSRAAAARLEPEGIVFVGSTYPEVRHGRVLLDPQGESIEVDLVVGLCRGGAEAPPAEPLGVGSAHGSRSPEPVRPVALAA